MGARSRLRVWVWGGFVVERSHKSIRSHASTGTADPTSVVRRIRVVPDKPEPGFYRSAIGWGAVASVFAYVATELPFAPFDHNTNWLLKLDGWMGTALLVYFVVPLLVPPVLFAFWSCVRTRRPVAVLVANLCFHGGAWLAASIWHSTRGLTITSPWWVWIPDWQSIALRITRAIGLSVLAFFGLRMVFRLVVQDGTRCYRCVYDLSGLGGAAACPECGTPRDQPPGNQCLRWIDARVRRFAWVLIAVCIAIGTGSYAIRWNRTMAPLRRQLAGLGATEFRDVLITSRAGGAESAGYGGVVPVDLGRGLRLVVTVPADRSDPRRSVQLQLFSEIAVPIFAIERQVVVPLMHTVICDLTPRQSAVLWRDGIPPGLVDRFRQEAESIPVPGPPSTYLFGMFHFWPPTEGPITSVIIEPSEFFGEP
ncbi:MAG: hypothetical protein GIKADHBN_03440 [Phycisphaerales bacterium]|nr:hypothetical protein [Phycisphaerales bacterium]